MTSSLPNVPLSFTAALVAAAILVAVCTQAARPLLAAARKPRGSGERQRPTRLDALRSLVAGNPLLPIIAGIGFSLSFQTIAHQATVHHLPGWAPLYPILIDTGILAFTIEARHAIDAGRSDLVPRMITWALSAFTVYVNVHGSPPHDWLGRSMHAAAPAMWVLFLELTRWRKVRKVRAEKQPDRIPRIRWLLRPLRTAGMWRRMTEHGVTSYTIAVARESARLLAIDLTRAAYGKNWKHDGPPLLVSQLHEGTLPAEVAEVCAEARPGLPVDVADLVETWVVEAKTRRIKAAVRVTREEQRAMAPEVDSEAPSEDAHEVPADGDSEVPAKDAAGGPSRGDRTAVQEAQRIARRKGPRQVPRELLLEGVGELYAGDEPPSVYRVVKELPVGEKTAKELLAEITSKGADVIAIGARQ
jgi:Protein of unknown function (DUF2637)